LLYRAEIEDWLSDHCDWREEHVAHYTRIQTLDYLTASGVGGIASAWATPVQFLNDRSEMIHGLQVLRESFEAPPQSSLRALAMLDRMLETPGDLSTDVFQMSFSAATDELGQWRAYAANGMGCSVVTKASDVQGAADIAGWIVYAPKLQKAFAREVKGLIRGIKDTNELQRILTAAGCFMKHEGFAPEREYRLLRFLDGDTIGFRTVNERIVPYIDCLDNRRATLSIIRVIVGPGWQLNDLQPGLMARHHVVMALRRLLDNRRLANARIQPSQIPYDPR
jgi:hypothetical protein